ncbi:hypothetical protein EB796_011644 [Bugula neritina]|uniref:RING-type domain-containing protein n=1 Tax=Bugula neritina TaxID=10212 RepID=A0A7J7JVQ9_BUGNE|nr:hypothetical protein EB796_011644 [Bugula neritina]
MNVNICMIMDKPSYGYKIMPPKHKQSKDSIRRKQEIADQVKEIKDRQQKWMNEKKLSESGKLSTVLPDNDLDIKTRDQHSMRTANYSASCPDGYKSAKSSPLYRPSNYKTPSRNDIGEDNYDVIADEIIHRVKNSLGGNLKTDSFEHNGEDREPSKPLAAHMCYKCQKLMISPHHSPMMLIPCGHNLCEACCRSAATCYICNTEVNGQSTNVILGQVIQNQYSQSREEAKRHRKSARKLHPAVADVEQEMQTLLLRKEAMEEEKLTIEESIERLNNRILGEMEQISGVEREESNVISQISWLQKKLMTLQEHKNDFKEKITSHNSHIEDEKKRINMINETLEYLSEKLHSLGSKT